MRENNNYASVVSIINTESIGETNMIALEFFPYFQMISTVSFAPIGFEGKTADMFYSFATINFNVMSINRDEVPGFSTYNV